MDQFIIGDLSVKLDLEDFPLEPDNLISPFASHDPIAEADITFRLLSMDPSGFQDAQCLRRTGGFELLRMEDRLFLMNHWARLRFGYGLWLEDLNRDTPVSVWMNPKIRDELPLAITRFFSSVGLHSKLLQHGAPVLHASYIAHQGAGILFTAPSGTGKSTQAELWQLYAGAEIRNGDRVLLGKRDGKWFSHGYPCCGSSMICLNRSAPLAAIIVLEQAAENIVLEMSSAAKIRALVSATELYPWDQKEIDLAFSLASQIVSEVPVVKLCCRPDEKAVHVLKKYLEEKGYANCI